MTTIFMPLLNDGTTVWKPVAAERLSLHYAAHTDGCGLTI
jgi:hypothetical protein